MTLIDPTLTPEARLARLGLVLPNVPSPVGAFCNVRRSGNMLYISGQGPLQADGTFASGKVGAEVSAEQARGHAERVGMVILAILRDYCGSLDSVAGIVKLLGLVNATPDFERHPFVIDGASELLSSVFGETGIHARSAFGVSSLPNRISVEIEAICELN